MPKKKTAATKSRNRKSKLRSLSISVEEKISFLENENLSQTQPIFEDHIFCFGCRCQGASTSSLICKFEAPFQVSETTQDILFCYGDICQGYPSTSNIVCIFDKQDIVLQKLLKKRSYNIKENMSQERLEKKHKSDWVSEMSHERLAKKRTSDLVSEMSEERIEKRHKTQRQTKIMKLPTQFYAADISTLAYQTVECHSVGKMEIECQHCGAVRFKSVKGRSVNSCCHQGKVSIPPLHEYPEELKELLTSETKESKHFRQYIRTYNSSFAFATFGAKIEDIKRGPPLVKIQGQVYHHATTSLINKGNTPRNGQIYIYDNLDEVVKIRIKFPNVELTRRIEELLRKVNPYAQKYKMLHNMTTNGEDYILQFVKYKFDDKRRYNVPTSSELAAIIVAKDGCIPVCDLRVYPKQDDGRETTIIQQTSQHADPMVFPLLFPKGDLGWSYNMTSQNGKRISPVQYFGHRLALRPRESFNPILNCERLSQQYVINCYVMVERQRLDFIRHNQGSLRSECYQGLVDHVEGTSLNDANRVRLGTAIILPATYIGSPRCMQQLYQDAIAISRKVGRPDFFITMTCNPQWPEITQTLAHYFVRGTAVNDIPTIVTNIFQTKVNEVIHDLLKKQIFGPIVAYLYTIEFQKRGLPHAHILAALRSDCKLLKPEDVDRFITAELSDDDTSLRYFQLRHMMHGPHFPGLLCWNEEKKECSKGFPKEFIEDTDMTVDGFPKYRRRDNTTKLYAHLRKVDGKVVYTDNRMVVPHNPYLLKKYNCHINVEYCSSVMAIKYIHKYIHKGHDRARMEMKQMDNEVSSYLDSRYVGPMEAAWRLNEIPLHDRSHNVVRLPVHLPGQQYVRFQEGHEEEVVSNTKVAITMLLAWFNLNKEDPAARVILYGNIPENYSWNSSSKKWVARRKKINVVGRVANISPRDSERFFLKLILNRIPGATCYEDLRIVDTVVHHTFREAAIAFGLTESCEEATAVLEEASATMMPKELRRFFVYYLIGDEPSDALQLWERFQEHMTDRDCSTYQALCEIEEQLNAENRTCIDFGLTHPSHYEQPTQNVDIDHHTKLFKNIKQLFNREQICAYERIIQSVTEEIPRRQSLFFIDGPGGTGKTFLYNGLYHSLIAMKMRVACVAWTGIASILLPSGTTSHRFFNLPIELNEEGVCMLKIRDKIRLQEIDVIIWDEASMISRKAMETIDRTLRDLMKNDMPFGGKVFILGGDFRQVLPVVKKASRKQVINDTIKSSHLWPLFEIHHLIVNMRAAEESKDFTDWLLHVGSGELTTLTIDEKSDFYCKDMVSWFFDGVRDFNTGLLDRIILSPQNDEVNRINDKILSSIPGEVVISYSIDKATLHGIDKSDAREEEATLRYPIEHLNSISVPGLPPHRLKLKVGCIVMLIRNLSIVDGLCNGTRLTVINIGNRVLMCRIIIGDRKNTIVSIPRIQLNTSTSNSSLPFVLYRRQFPVRLAYALTINKAQGQTFDRVGLFIERPIFSHGQLYVALSRCVSKSNIKIYVKEGKSIQNIVYKEILEH